MENIHIDPTKFNLGVKCALALFQEAFNPENAKVNPNKEMLYDISNEVVSYVEQEYSDGIRIKNFATTTSEKIDETNYHLQKSYAVMFGPYIKFQNLIAKPHILIKAIRTTRMICITSSTSFSEDFILKCAFNYFVTKWSGIEVNEIRGICVNPDYVCEKACEVNTDEGLLNEDITHRCIKLEDVIKKMVSEQTQVLKGKKPYVPINLNCLKPECKFKDHCFKKIPEQSIFTIPYLHKKVMFNWHSKGVTTLKEVYNSGLALNPYQHRVVECTVKNQIYIDEKGIKQYLKKLQWPVSSWDVESFMEPISTVVGAKNFSHQVFMYSLDRMEKNFEITHTDFISQPGIDQRKILLKKFLKEVAGQGSILVWNISYERSILESLRLSFPKYESEIDAVIMRLFDIMPIFRDYFFHPKFKGFSLKTVLPALVDENELTYLGLPVSNGAAASSAFRAMRKMSIKDAEIMKANLLRYNEVDTRSVCLILKNLIENLKL